MNPPSTSNILGFGQRVLDSFGAKKKKSLVLWVFKGFFQKNFLNFLSHEKMFFFETFLPHAWFCVRVEKKLSTQERKEKKLKKQKKTMLIFYSEFNLKQPCSFLKKENYSVWHQCNDTKFFFLLESTTKQSVFFLQNTFLGIVPKQWF